MYGWLTLAMLGAARSCGGVGPVSILSQCGSLSEHNGAKVENKY